MACETTLSINITSDTVPDDVTAEDEKAAESGHSIEISLDEDGNTEEAAHFELDKETGKQVWVEAKVRTSFVFGETAYLKVIRTDTITPYNLYPSFGKVEFVGIGFTYICSETVEFTDSDEADLGKVPAGEVTTSWNGYDPGVKITFDGKKIKLSSKIKVGILECVYRVSGERWALRCPYPCKSELTEQPIKVVAIQGTLNGSANVSFMTPEEKEAEEAEAVKDSSTTKEATIEISLDESQNLERDDSYDPSKAVSNPNIPPGYKEKTEFGIPGIAVLKVIVFNFENMQTGIASVKSDKLKAGETTFSQACTILSAGSKNKISQYYDVGTRGIKYMWLFSDKSWLKATFSGDSGLSDNFLVLKDMEVSQTSKAVVTDYKVESSAGTVSKSGSGYIYQVVDTINFDRESEGALKYVPKRIVSYEWIGKQPSVSPVFSGKNVSVQTKVIAQLKVIYEIAYDRWQLSVSSPIGSLGTPSGEALEVVCVAYQDDAKASVTVSFQNKEEETSVPKNKILAAMDCENNPIPGAVIVFKGTPYVMAENGERNIGLVAPGTYNVTGYAAGFSIMTKEVTVA